MCEVTARKETLEEAMERGSAALVKITEILVARGVIAEDEPALDSLLDRDTHSRRAAPPERPT